jgi:hypothetical protein
MMPILFIFLETATTLKPAVESSYSLSEKSF